MATMTSPGSRSTSKRSTTICWTSKTVAANCPKVWKNTTPSKNWKRQSVRGESNWRDDKNTIDLVFADDFNETCPLLEMMANKSMKPRHWERIANVTGHKFDIESDNFLLRDIMAAPLLKYKEDIEVSGRRWTEWHDRMTVSFLRRISVSRPSKKKISKRNWIKWLLIGAIRTFSSVCSKLAVNYSWKVMLLVKSSPWWKIPWWYSARWCPIGNQQLSLTLEPISLLLSLSAFSYNAPFKKKIQEWVQKLTSTTEIIEKWMSVQNLWIYLEAVFVGGDIAKQLPAEAKRFGNIDKSWQKIMQRAHENLNVVSCCTADDTLAQLLPHLFEQLELCQKSLTGYLEKKRLVFPRFFFVSDPALLEILGQASDSHTIQVNQPPRSLMESHLEPSFLRLRTISWVSSITPNWWHSTIKSMTRFWKSTLKKEKWCHWKNQSWHR